MPDLVTTVTTCRVCGARDWHEVMSFGDMPLANGYVDPALPAHAELQLPLDVMVCGQCWLMTLRQVVSPEVLYHDYVYISSDSRQIAEHMHQFAEQTAFRYPMPAGSLVVEIGSNIGSQLDVFQQRGMRTVGIDPALNLVDIANDAGIPTIAGFFNADSADAVLRHHGHAQLLIGRHVFAHIDDVANVLRAARQILTPSGIVAFEVPYLLDLIRKTQFDTIYHEHLSYFAVQTLHVLFARHGFQLLDVTHHAVHGGSLVIYAGLQGGLWPVSPAIEAFEVQERNLGLNTWDAYRQFAVRTESIISTIGDSVRSLALQGQCIAAYGAPAKGNTLLNACGLSATEIVYASDTTVYKQGKQLPGSRIPVVSPAYSVRHPPDYFLLLPWNYADEILSRESERRNAGIQFIVPIPSPRIIGRDATVWQSLSQTLDH